jgi:hypothetical protein
MAIGMRAMLKSFALEMQFSRRFRRRITIFVLQPFGDSFP